MAKIIELILSETNRGVGKESDPYRSVTQIWTKDGNLVVEHDPCGKEIGENMFEPTDFVNLKNI